MTSLDPAPISTVSAEQHTNNPFTDEKYEAVATAAKVPQISNTNSSGIASNSGKKKKKKRKGGTSAVVNASTNGSGTATNREMTVDTTGEITNNEQGDLFITGIVDIISQDDQTSGAASGSKKAKKKKKKKSNTNNSNNNAIDGNAGVSKEVDSRQLNATTINSTTNHKNKSNDRIWNTNTNEERERIKDFWLSLGEDERRSLVKVEKEAVLRKMKEQQKHSCSCSVCGRKRNAIEEELEVLYDAYYEELEQYANQQQRYGPVPPPSLRLPYGALGSHSSARVRELADDEEEDELDDDDDFSDPDSADLISHDISRDFFDFGHSLTVQEGILTVADDLLKNDGKKFIEMMEQLAERRMAREEEALAATEYEDDEDYDDEEEEEEEEEEYDDEEDDDIDSMSEEQRMEEGRRMFQIFAARMFEQRVLTAYREKVAQERQRKLLEELEEENRLREERELKKAKEKEKKKDKKRQQKLAKEEERIRREAEKAAEEALQKEEELRKAEELRKKREEQRLKKEAEKRAQEEERHRREEELRRKRLQEEKEREAERERKRKEKEERERKRKEKEEQARRERELREQQERDLKLKREKEEQEHRRLEMERKQREEREKQESLEAERQRLEKESRERELKEREARARKESLQRELYIKRLQQQPAQQVGQSSSHVPFSQPQAISYSQNKQQSSFFANSVTPVANGAAASYSQTVASSMPSSQTPLKVASSRSNFTPLQMTTRAATSTSSSPSSPSLNSLPSHLPHVPPMSPSQQPNQLPSLSILSRSLGLNDYSLDQSTAVSTTGRADHAVNSISLGLYNSSISSNNHSAIPSATGPPGYRGFTSPLSPNGLGGTASPATRQGQLNRSSFVGLDYIPAGHHMPTVPNFPFASSTNAPAPLNLPPISTGAPSGMALSSRSSTPVANDVLQQSATSAVGTPVLNENRLSVGGFEAVSNTNTVGPNGLGQLSPKSKPIQRPHPIRRPSGNISRGEDQFGNYGIIIGNEDFIGTEPPVMGSRALYKEDDEDILEGMAGTFFQPSARHAYSSATNSSNGIVANTSNHSSSSTPVGNTRSLFSQSSLFFDPIGSSNRLAAEQTSSLFGNTWNVGLGLATGPTSTNPAATVPAPAMSPWSDAWSNDNLNNHNNRKRM
ncbi:salt tolerance down-regulator-domain-containing protein [Dipodascopsis uninucleata]